MGLVDEGFGERLAEGKSGFEDVVEVSGNGSVA